MVNIIEIPEDLLRDLIESSECGDSVNEARKLLPQPENYFGRWATYHDGERYLCLSKKPDRFGNVTVVQENAAIDASKKWTWVSFKELTFDPLYLTTEEDFDNAPVGTIVSSECLLPREKIVSGYWRGFEPFDSHEMADRGPWDVVRWGTGEGK